MLNPITDMLNRIRNAQSVHHKTVDIPYSKVKFALSVVLDKEGFIAGARIKKRKKEKIIELGLKYLPNGLPRISGLKRISKSSQKVYKKSKDIKKVKGGYGRVIISTSQGLMSNIEAHKAKLGGEILVEVW